ncbi:hypothetical protein HF325_004557 [Metschnikowia pulcherrima]|uniref:RNI-like protein n=1 Tax=Metschnikowia pulcherrima TaxID=27326 RepID=A0A8H7GP77_9ASCO|nr:hypothetical protein HF325_004557 [Metschnikowia pulcherrima]
MSAAPPSDIETGVSNGDVDWLFRGKSKKLEKKRNSERKPSVSLAPEKPDSQEKDGAGTGSEIAKSEEKSKPCPSSPSMPQTSSKSLTADSKLLPRMLAMKSTQPDSPTTQLNENVDNFKTASKPENKETPSTSRSRSSLAPQQPPELHNLPHRLPPWRHAEGPAHKPPLLPQQQVSRSNSGKGRLFFSSLSLKFKPSAFSSPSSSSLASTAASASQILRAALPLSAHPLAAGKSPKTPTQVGHKDREQDLAASVKKPPQELGISIPAKTRRPSLSSLSPRLSVEKERGGFFKRRLLVADQANSGPTNSDKGTKTTTGKPQKPKRQLRRVSFALDKLDADPQQQIPSRRPRKGNVLIPEDLKAPPPRLALGISTTDGSRTASASEPKYSEKEMQLAIEAQNRALLEAEKHAMEAHLSAKKLAYQIANHRSSNKTAMANVDEDEVSENAGNIEIDNPLHIHENHFEDVTSLVDFIAIMPINTVIFDNVTMTTEMLKHVLSGLVHNKHLEKLSLRNVAIDEVGWGYLCEFMSRNQTVKKLDISQQRVKHLTKPTSFRASMNWNLFIDALKSRNGIEELVMGGCKLSDETFENLLENAITISTCRLGVAATEINVRKCEMLADWISRLNSKCVGIDIAYNDLSQGQLRPFIDAFNTKTVNLVFFSLNSTSLTNVEEVGELLWGLTRLKNLRFFDFSSLPQLFPHVISKLGKHLPNFESLRRIHFDLNELTSQSIAALADVFPKVQNLVHVSLLGNKNLDRGSIGALYTAVKSSSIFTLDLDYDLVPDELSQRLALYLMRNFDKVVKPNIDDYAGDNEQDDVMFDGSLLMETAEKMLVESDQNLGEVDFKLQKIITNALIERTNSVRKEMHREGKENLLRFCLLDASLEKLVHMFEQKAKMFSVTPMTPSPSVQETKDPIGNLDLGREQLHEGSSALIATGPILMAGTARSNMANMIPGNESTFQPHLVVIDANSEGRNVIIDNLTGRPILMKSVSQTSIHAKEQEEEEGEFLRWGYFMEHRDGRERVSDSPPEESKQEVSVFGAVPSGSELREAIIDAKGVESVTDLISKINNQRVSLDNIYNAKISGHVSGDDEGDAPLMMRSKSETFQDAFEKPASDDDNASIDSSESHDVHPVVDEAYDKLLNEAQRVMSNK